MNLLPASSLLVSHVGRPLRRQLCTKNEPADKLVHALVHPALRVEVAGNSRDCATLGLSL